MSECVAAAVLAAASDHPSRVALRTGEATETTYGALLDIARRWAAALPSGCRVALSPRSDPESVASVIGTWLAGSSVVLMHRHLTRSQTTAVIDRSRAAIVIDDRMEANHRPGTGAVPADGEMLVGLTSGSSGTPKLFARDHASWLATFARSDLLVDVVADDVVAAPGAVDHSHFLYGLIHALSRGATVDLRVTEHSDWEHATVMYSVPTIATGLVGRRQRLGRLRTVLSSGAAWPPAARARFQQLLPPGVQVYDFYGAGELSFVSVSDGDGPAGSLGRPFPGVDIRIRRSDGTLADPGQSGLIEVSSDMLFSGYLTPSGTVEAATDWVTAGDHGHLDDAGWLFLTGRQSRMFTRGALNVEPEAIERILAQHPDITAAACVARPSPRWGAVPVAFVTTSRSATSTEFDRWCTERLDPLHRPTRIYILNELPTTHRGKPDYSALEQLAEAAPLDSASRKESLT